MGILLELLLTAALSVLLAFLLGKIFALDSSADDPEEKRERSAETVGEIRWDAVDDGEGRRAAEEVLGSDRVAAAATAAADKSSKEHGDEEDGCILVRSEDDVLVDRSLERSAEARGGLEVVEELGWDEVSAERMVEGVGLEKAKEDKRSEEVRTHEIGVEIVNLEIKKEEARIYEGNIEMLADVSTRDITEEVTMLRLERLPEDEKRLIMGVEVTEVEPAMEKEEEPDMSVLNLNDGSFSNVAEIERLLQEEGRSDEVIANELDTPGHSNEQEKISEVNVVRLESASEMPEKVALEKFVEEKQLFIKEKCSEESSASDFDLEKKTEDDSTRELLDVVVEETRGEQKLLREEERTVDVTSSNFEQHSEIEQEKIPQANAVKSEEDSTQEMPVVEIDIVNSPNWVGQEEGFAEGEVCTDKVVQSLEEERMLQEGSQNETKELKVCIQEEGSLLNEEDDWEGIEKSELEKRFGAAVAYIGGGGGGDALSKLSSDVQMQLYGLHKVATEGPCYESQPLALKVSARAKWHAWQRLGNMNPEMAMEQYMTILSESIPGWIEGKPREGSTYPETMVSGIEKLDSCSTSCGQCSSETVRNIEGPSCSEEEHATAGSEHQMKEP